MQSGYVDGIDIDDVDIGNNLDLIETRMQEQ
jgi:hypothetical protein